MDVADQVNVGRQVGQDALAAIGAVAGNEDLIVGKPLGNQANQLQRQLRAAAMVGIWFAGGRLALPLLFRLGIPWRLR